jgi:hypothetical protein
MQANSPRLTYEVAPAPDNAAPREMPKTSAPPSYWADAVKITPPVAAPEPFPAAPEKIAAPTRTLLPPAPLGASLWSGSATVWLAAAPWQRRTVAA